MKQAEIIELVESTVKEVSKVIMGRNEEVEMILMALFADGHVLLEGVPGTAKTLMVETISKVLGGKFRRIQFVPDMLPSDITGTYIYASGEFVVQHGPLYGMNFVLVDEINRAPARTQAALLQAMQEREISIVGKDTFQLNDPFIVLATQNPIEQEGTYVLPEAQIDRFMIKVPIDHISREEEKRMIKNRRLDQRDKMSGLSKILDPEKIILIRDLVKNIKVSDKAIEYILDITRATRIKQGWDSNDPELEVIKLGASPRAELNIRSMARVKAFLSGKTAVFPEDIDYVKENILRHRIAINFKAAAKGWTADNVLEIINKRIRPA